MTYYKAIRPGGTDFYTGTVQWAPEQGDIPAYPSRAARPVGRRDCTPATRQGSRPMTVTPIRRTSPKPADREFQAAMARNLARIVADYDTAGTSPEVAADVRAIPDLLNDIADTLAEAARELAVHAEEMRLDRLAEAARDACDEREAL